VEFTLYKKTAEKQGFMKPSVQKITLKTVTSELLKTHSERNKNILLFKRGLF